MTKRHTFLAAKILTYRFNAYLDAQLAAELISYLHTKKLATHHTEASYRAERYLKLQQNTSPEFIAGLAYTLYYGNGLANYLYTKMLTNILSPRYKKTTLNILDQYTHQFLKTLNTEKLYREFDHPQYLRKYWLQMLINSFKWQKEFIKNRKLPFQTIPTEVMKKTAHIVQRDNSQFNKLIASRLLENKKSSIPKVNLLQQAAQEFPNPQVFLRSAAGTQQAAARWDKLYTVILKKGNYLVKSNFFKSSL